jgi:SAM-dependent methyltransferase
VSECALCGSRMRGRFRVREFTVVRCDRCDLERVDPMPSEADVAAVYARGYFSGEGHGYRDYFGRERAVADAKARARMDALAQHGLGASSSVLELGCADGRFLLEAFARGHAVRGVEASREARDAADPAVRARIEARWDALGADERFAAFAAFDVLEHLPDPIGALRAARAKLRPGALVAVVVPVIENVNARWAPWTWDQYKPPEHLWFFSRRSLTTLVEQTLGARVLGCVPAWEREARVLSATLRRGGLLARAEAWCWRAMRARRWIDPTGLEDSAMLVAKVGEP